MLAHLAWKNLCRPAHRRLRQALKNPREAQTRVLQRILATVSAAWYGRKTGMQPGMSMAEFQREVPIVSHEDLRPLIERAAAGEAGVLTTEPVLMFETSSGTSAAAKLIPYTRSLRREFQEAIRGWMSDLYASHPAIAKGRHYWSITPLHRETRRTAGGIPIGFDEDAEYLGRMERWLASRLFAVPSNVGKQATIETCLAATREHLRKARDLTFISVWSPSFLEMLLDGFAEPPAELWPGLAVVSCWGDAASSAGFSALRHRLPGVTLQRKGLLATEGFMTLPLEAVKQPGCLPALNSHFLEFLPDEEAGQPRAALLCDELEEGGEYSILLTTGGGLCRYRIGDRVRCTRMVDGVPRLEFLGKEDGVCDLHGEKLNPLFVSRALEHLRGSLLLDGGFLMLAPADDGSCYVLISDGGPAEGLTLAAVLDRLLCENPHYRYCREAGQLAPLRPVAGGGQVSRRYVERCVSLGQRAGDVKPVALHCVPGWEAWLQFGTAPS